MSCELIVNSGAESSGAESSGVDSCAGDVCSDFDSDDDSDDDSDYDSADVDADVPLSLRESQRKRRSNLPEFKMFSDDQEQELPPSRAKDHATNRNAVALTREELDAVVATFSTFTSFAAVRMRRQAEAAQAASKLLFYDSISQSSTALPNTGGFGFKANQTVETNGDLLERNNSSAEAVYDDGKKGIQHSNMPSPSTRHLKNHRTRKATWRKLRDHKGNVLSVEIIKEDTNTAKVDRFPKHHSETKRQPCAVCQHSYLKSSLLGKVSRMAIAKLRRKWRGNRAHDGKTDHGSKKNTIEHWDKYGFSRCYDYEHVCLFCLQLFDVGVIDEEPSDGSDGIGTTADRSEETSTNTDTIDEVLAAVKVQWPERVKPRPESDTFSTRNDSPFRVSYKAFPTQWRAFDQEVLVSVRRSPVRKRRVYKVRKAPLIIGKSQQNMSATLQHVAARGQRKKFSSNKKDPYSLTARMYESFANKIQQHQRPPATLRRYAVSERSRKR